MRLPARELIKALSSSHLPQNKNIARGRTNPGCCFYNLSYLSRYKVNLEESSKFGDQKAPLALIKNLPTRLYCHITLDSPIGIWHYQLVLVSSSARVTSDRFQKGV